MEGPLSSYSYLVIHNVGKVESEAKIEPPIHTEYFRYGVATTLIFIVAGASAVISRCILAAMPGKSVFPPLNAIFSYSYRLISTSHFIMELKRS